MMQLDQLHPGVEASDLAPPRETVACRLIITRNSHSEVLTRIEKDRNLLPEVQIPKWERATPHLTSAASKQWGVNCVVLFCVPTESFVCEGGSARTYILEAVDPSASASNGTQWVRLGDVSAADRVIESAIGLAEALGRSGCGAFFAQPGWFGNLKTWMAEPLRRRGWRLTGEFTQYTSGPESCLLRCQTTGPNVWFKAVGAANSEYRITLSISTFASSLIPQIMAQKDDWGGWMALEVPGGSLDSCWDLDCWKSTARSLAELQLKSLGSTSHLLAAGCKDLSLESICSLTPELFERIAVLMTHQPSSPPPVLTRDELRFLQDRLLEASAELDRVKIPSALGHSDLNPGNVIANQKGAVFLDWAGATITHPFFGLEYLIALLRRLRPDLEHWVRELRKAYSDPWRELCSAEQFHVAFKLTPALAALAYALGATNWKTEPEEMRPPMAKLIRALARRMRMEVLNQDISNERR